MVAHPQDKTYRPKTDEELLAEADPEVMAKIREKNRIVLAQAATNGPRMEQRRRDRLAMYERKYGMSSDTMARRLESGELQDTPETWRWFVQWRLLQDDIRDATLTTGTP